MASIFANLTKLLAAENGAADSLSESEKQSLMGCDSFRELAVSLQTLAPQATFKAGNKAAAIIGGGISGLVCANRLRELGLRPVVFDTGRRECGGRCSSPSLPSSASAPGGTTGSG